MGKRKKSGKKVTVQKRVYKIPKYFECPFCGRKDGIKITISNKDRTADLLCRSCGVEEKDIEVTQLTEPIDIYDDWMDRARETNVEYNPEREEVKSDSDNDEPPIRPSDSDEDYKPKIQHELTKASNSSDSDSDLQASSYSSSTQSSDIESDSD